MGGMGIFITYSDDYSKFGYVYRISNEVDTFIIFKVGLDQGDMSSKFNFFHWSMGLFFSYVNQCLYCKMERWKEHIKL